MTVRIVEAFPHHIDVWATMRSALWPDEPVAEHRRHATALFGRIGVAAFVAVATGGETVGFVEASLRRDHVDGCDTSPVAFVDGLYVERGLAVPASPWRSSPRSRTGAGWWAVSSLLRTRRSTTARAMISTEPSRSRRPNASCISGEAFEARPVRSRDRTPSTPSA